MFVVIAAACLAALAVAWLIERRHILTLRAELEAWGKGATHE